MLLRALARLILWPPAPVASMLRAAGERERAIAHAAGTRAAAALRAREDDVLNVYESSATALVQAGLFDHRAIQDARRRRRLVDEQRTTLSADRDSSTEPMAVTTALAAAVFVREPRGR
jgi:hypothetical protein